MIILFLLALVGFLGFKVNYHDLGTYYYQHFSNPSLVYDFPVPLENGSALFPMRKCRGHQLEESSIDGLQALLHSRTLSSVDLVYCYQERIYQTSSYLKYVHGPLALQIEPGFDLTTIKCRPAAQP